MAHYALLDENNIVVNVFVGKDEEDTTLDWEEHYGEVSGLTCKRTSYNSFMGKHIDPNKEAYRKNYATIGYTYDESRDAFIPPKDFESWVLNEETCWWEAPIPMPDDGYHYDWDEFELEWVRIYENILED